jgi:two-component system phosphate regulon sensor histidine kinase PhoR
MQSQSGRMARLIDDLLSLSRIEMKPLLKPGEAADLAGVVRGVAESLAPLARESGVTIGCELPSGWVMIPGDADELVQVFQNLIENACKYGSSGGRVSVGLALADGGARAFVRDFGPGIPEEHLPRVTERFYRVDDGAGRSQKGTGLGLAIVKHIVTRHNARLSIESRQGEGATVTIYFPTAKHVGNEAA